MRKWRASRSPKGPGSLRLGGYVLPEILAVVGILTILILVAMPRLVLPETLDASTFTRQVAADLRLARQLAFSRRDTFGLKFSPGGGPFTSYTVWNVSTGVVEPDFPKPIPGELSVSGREQFRFTSGAWGPYDELGVGADGTVTVTAGSATATITVFWYNGRVQVTGP